MNLPKAIEIELIHNNHNPDFTDTEREQAHQLGIEAMKFIEDTREITAPYFPHLLPGETEE